MNGIRVEEDLTRPPGHARVRIFGAVGLAANPAFQIHRQGLAESVLGAGGWQVAEASLMPDAVETEGADLILLIGPQQCRHILAGTYQFSLPAARLELLVVWPDIASPYEGREGIFNDPAQALPSSTVPRTQPRNPVPPPVADPAPMAEPRGKIVPGPVGPVGGRGQKENKARSLAPWVAAAVVVVLAVAGGGWYYAGHHAPAAAQPARQAAADLDAMPVPELIQRNNPTEMFAQAERRLASRPNEAMLLFEAAGDDRHHGPALAALAHLYDPAKPRQGAIAADPRQAARYYREAGEVGQPVDADREALRAELDRRQQAGDLTAKLVLQDFWR